MRTLFAAVPLLFFWVSFSFAQQQEETKFEVKQVIESRQLVIVRMTGPLVDFEKGRIFVATFDDGKQCSLSFLEATDRLIKLSSSRCARASEISTKSMIEPSLMNTLVDESPTVEGEKKRSTDTVSAPGVAFNLNDRFAVFVQYSSANQLNFEDAHLTSTAATGPLSIKISTEGAAGIGLSFVRMNPQGLGFSFSGIYEGERKLKSFRFTGSGGTVVGNIVGSKPKFSLFLLEGDLIYRWDRFYLPFGIHFAKVQISGYPGDLDVQNGGGIHLAAGYLFAESAAMEFFIRSTAFQMTERDSTGTLDYGMGSLVGFGLVGKFFF